jgi:intracellular septation protein
MESPPIPPPAPGPRAASSLRSLLLGGLLPVIAFTVIDEYCGPIWGIVAGMAFGVGEIAWEWLTQKRVELLTWIGNGMLIVLGIISFATQSGVWFKLQPAILEAAMGLLMVGSVLIGRPFLLLMARKQRMFAQVPPGFETVLSQAMTGFTVRVGIFFLGHAAIAGWAAVYWSTRAWAILKGVGFTGTFLVYMFLEAVLLRRRIARARQGGVSIGFQG